MFAKPRNSTRVSRQIPQQLRNFENQQKESSLHQISTILSQRFSTLTKFERDLRMDHDLHFLDIFEDGVIQNDDNDTFEDIVIPNDNDDSDMLSFLDSLTPIDLKNDENPFAHDYQDLTCFTPAASAVTTSELKRGIAQTQSTEVKQPLKKCLNSTHTSPVKVFGVEQTSQLRLQQNDDTFEDFNIQNDNDNPNMFSFLNSLTLHELQSDESPFVNYEQDSTPATSVVKRDIAQTQAQIQLTEVGQPVKKRIKSTSKAPAKVSGAEQASHQVVKNTSSPSQTRTVPWRKPGSDKNHRMRGAVWVYRFAPLVPSHAVQKAFGVSVKSMMRYVKDSCNPDFQKYDLFFGIAGKSVAGLADRALERGRKGHRKSVKSTGYKLNMHTNGIPKLAREFLEQY